MKTVLIDPTTRRPGIGSEYRPYKSLNDVPFAPGLRCLLKAGTVTHEHAVITAGGNSEDDRVVIGRYGDGPDPIIDGNGFNRCLTVNGGVNFVTIEDIRTTGANNNAMGTVRGIAVGSNNSNRSDHVIIQRVEIDQIGYPSPSDDANGISAFGQDFALYDSIIHDIADDGVWVSGARPVIGRNHIHSVAQSNRIAGDCVQFSTDACPDYHVFWNSLDHSSVEMKQCFIDGGTGVAAGGLFEFNTCSMGTDLTSESKVINLQNSNVIARGNISSGGHNAFWLGSVLAYGNIAVNMRNYGFLFGNGHTAVAANNLAIGQGLGAGNGFRADSGIVSAGFYNNIALANENGFVCYKTDPLNNGLTVENNLAFDNTANAHTGYTAPLSNIIADPLLNDDWTLQDGSPCIDAGLKFWQGVRPVVMNMPLPDLMIDIGPLQTAKDFHPRQLRKITLLESLRHG